jgi:outer membrane protein TolC
LLLAHSLINEVSHSGFRTLPAKSSSLTDLRYRAGTATVLDWLDAERTRFSAEQDRVAGEAEMIKDFVALHKSLGLGWQS